MDAKKSNKIREIVRLKQILKKWKMLAKKNSTNSTLTKTNSMGSGGGGGGKGVKFLRKTFSFTDSMVSSISTDTVPKGFLAVCIGKELKRYVIPTHYLGHPAFRILLREAEEEFGFHQEGVLKIPCEVSIFEMILKFVEEKKDQVLLLHDYFQQYSESMEENSMNAVSGCCSPDCCEIFQSSSHPQLCR